MPGGTTSPSVSRFRSSTALTEFGAASAPEAVVARQLAAYNARDIDAFMATWRNDALYFEHPSTLLASGAEEIRARHVVRFAEPDLNGRLVARLSVGTMVVDREIVTRNFPDGIGEVDVIAIYEVDGDKIAKAWFKMGTPRPAARV
ncbi:MAG: nuclear transport factor 2 family protein [Alphaproteobacteria bacterium]|nr:nuclear transport factor 2 family protein [Alphaproteobacteria bacterium]